MVSPGMRASAAWSGLPRPWVALDSGRSWHAIVSFEIGARRSGHQRPRESRLCAAERDSAPRASRPARLLRSRFGVRRHSRTDRSVLSGGVHPRYPVELSQKNISPGKCRLTPPNYPIHLADPVHRPGPPCATTRVRPAFWRDPAARASPLAPPDQAGCRADHSLSQVTMAAATSSPSSE